MTLRKDSGTEAGTSAGPANSRSTFTFAQAVRPAVQPPALKEAMRTRLVLAVLPVALIGVTAAGSFAAPKPTKGSFDASASPDPTPVAGEVCQGRTPSGRFEVPLKIPAAGKLKVDLTGFQGDWDLTVEGKGSAILAQSAGFVEATTETVTVKFKKKTDITIVACNFAGGPTAKGSYVFTPVK